MYPQGILVTEEEERDIELLTLGACPSPVAITIGGGGDAFSGGGGSGYVTYTTNLPQKAYLKMAVHPGSASEDSYVRDIADNREIVRGGRGQNGEVYDGGAGYSGGGGYGYPSSGGIGGGDGGSNGFKGEDGRSGVGGAGSGVQIDNIPITNYALSPGEGGYANNNYYGGGGGGVLIDGQGPDRLNSRIGEGYGGGGGSYYDDPYIGLPGAVILDFSPDDDE